MLYHAVHFVENCVFCSCPAVHPALSRPVTRSVTRSSSQRPSRPNWMQLSPEQMRIAYHPLKSTDVITDFLPFPFPHFLIYTFPFQLIKVVGLAATGKTETLIRFTEERPYMKFLVVTRNKSVPDQETTNQIPKQREAQNGTSTGARIRCWNTLKEGIGSAFHPNSIRRNQMLPKPSGIKKSDRETFALLTLRSFTGSDAERVSIAHTPCKQVFRERGVSYFFEEHINIYERLVSFFSFIM